MEKPILVFGATGKVGRRLTQRLLERAVPVRGVTRHPERLPGDVRSHPLFQLANADFEKPGRVEAVVEGVEAVYLMPPEESADPTRVEVELSKAVIDAAGAENVDQVMLHTWLRPGEGPTGARILDVKQAVEWELLVAGVPYTILRPGLFLDTLLDPALQERTDVFAAPFPPQRKVGVVAADDVAAVAAGLLLEGKKNRLFDLHIPGGVTGPAIAHALSFETGRRTEFQAYVGPSSEFVKGLPMGDAERELYAEFFDYLRGHDYVGQAGAIYSVLPEFRYTTVETYLRTLLSRPRTPPLRAPGGWSSTS